MKTTLFLALGWIFLAQAQTISEYYGHLAPVPGTEGINQRTYEVVTSANTLDESPSGVNATWTFEELAAIGPTVYENTAPTPGETGTYPGTTMVITNINSAGIIQTISKLYTVMNQAITGASSEATGINLDYSDNATIGTFPLAYGYSNTDAVSGTFAYGSFSGTFSGNIVSSVDGYGTLTTNDYGFGPNEVSVVRLKLVQTLTLDSVEPNVGTVKLTSNHYYIDGEAYPFITSASTSIDIPQESIDQTSSIIEAATGMILGTQSFDDDAVLLVPNPADDLVSIQTHGNIHSVIVDDINGRTVLNGLAPNHTFDVSRLAKGVYLARIETDSGTFTKKIVKE